MHLERIYREEDLFPREITFWEEREYGFLFYNEDNKDSYDSNHALIFKNRISDLNQVLEDIKDILSDYGFKSWSESQRYMVLSERNTIAPNAEITVAKKVLDNRNTLFFVAYYNEKPVGMTYAHVRDDVCRVDYLLVSKEHRNIGVGRALINGFVEYCKVNQIENCFLWPDGETAERIYYEAGFRHVDTKQAGRASYVKRINVFS